MSKKNTAPVKAATPAAVVASVVVEGEKEESIVKAEPTPGTDLLAVAEAEGSAKAEDRSNILPYVGHYGDRARPETRGPLDAAGVEVGEFYLHHITPIRVRPFELHLLKYARLYTKQDNKMNITDAVLESSNDLFREGFREHLFCAVAVRLPVYDEAGKIVRVALIPATMNLRSGQAQALSKTLAAWKYAADPIGWAARGAQYGPASKAVYPGGRMVTTIWSTSEDLADGNTFNKGHDTIRATPIADVETFNSFVSEQRPIINAVISRMMERLDEAKKKLRG